MNSFAQDAALFATAPFHRLVPARAGYQTLPIQDGFNWSYTLEPIPSGRWHLIVFRSQRKAGMDDGLLTRHDDLAFAEAMASGGLLRYYKGVTDRLGRCLSLCVWQSRRHAQVANRRPEHRVAAGLAMGFYDSYDVERYVLRKRRGQVEPEITSVLPVPRQSAGRAAPTILAQAGPAPAVPR
jgi:hypothetical protein